MIPLSELGTCKNGMNFASDEDGIEIAYLGVGDFKDNSRIDGVSGLSQISLNTMPSEEYLLKDEDIVFVRSNGSKELVGRCLAHSENMVCRLSTHRKKPLQFLLKK